MIVFVSEAERFGRQLLEGLSALERPDGADC